MHYHGFFKGILFTVIDVCLGHFVRFRNLVVYVLLLIVLCVCVCAYMCLCVHVRLQLCACSFALLLMTKVDRERPCLSCCKTKRSIYLRIHTL